MSSLEGGPSPINPEENADRLYLRGRWQVSTARDALARAGRNPDAQTLLTTMLETHEVFSDKTSRNDLVVFLQSENAGAMKKDIVDSLETLSKKEKTLESEKQTFRALHGLLTEE